MSRLMPGHRIAAIVVLVAAGAWVVTGKFSSVGSDQVLAAQPATDSAAAEPAKPGPVLPTVAAVMPVFADHERAIRISGVTQADKSVTLAARWNGVIATINVTEGQHIEAGSEVLTLDGPDLLAGVENAKAMLAQRVIELAADDKLAEGGNMPTLTLLAARTAKTAAESAVAQAEMAADQVILRAPFTGVVDSVTVEKGQWLLQGSPVATLISIDPIVVRAEVNELDVSEIGSGSKAQVTLVDGRIVEGTVRYLSKLASAVTRTFPVEVALANPDGKIPAGMTAQITLYAPPVRAVTVPRSVITLSDSGELGLRTVDAQHVTHFTPVTLVDDTPQGLVLAGVPDGVRIVVSGQDLVKDGQTVDVVAPPVGGPTLGGTNP